jgi:purine-binding chemotaxis protein CheW
MTTTSTVYENQEQALTAYLDSLIGVVAAEESPYARSAPAQATPVAAAPDESPERYFCFNVGGLRLALPLRRVGKLANFADCAGEGASALHVGYIEHHGRLVPVLAAAELVMPGRHPPIPYQVIVVDAAGKFALACHGIESELEVSRSEVQWKSDRTSRRWLAGTLIQRRCAMLDAEELARLAAAEDAQ